MHIVFFIYISINIRSLTDGFYVIAPRDSISSWAYRRNNYGICKSMLCVIKYVRHLLNYDSFFWPPFDFLVQLSDRIINLSKGVFILKTSPLKLYQTPRLSGGFLTQKGKTVRKGVTVLPVVAFCVIGMGKKHSSWQSLAFSFVLFPFCLCPSIRLCQINV